MYRRPKFLELLLTIREEMAVEAEYDLSQFVQDLLTASPEHETSGRASHAPSNGVASRKAATVKRKR